MASQTINDYDFYEADVGTNYISVVRRSLWKWAEILGAAVATSSAP
ncbi:hypothetical protein IXB28_01065 [Leptothoe kymatousa TAU-MAC 1615]|uniref:Uncharacterized protein n=1 Tax=Leptothoe kymatousa TAU-MAC 1615 TaxID=2364775 RepID=A0ABS5XZW6_9CYAN|nr:hypothetical protein [Leptothoe kymatousa TAU-MAC 1615]